MSKLLLFNVVKKVLVKLFYKLSYLSLKCINTLNNSRVIDKDCYIVSDSCQIPKLEDIYKLFLGFKTDGFFVEFGAYNGEYASNASGLADLGWGGVYIEPVEEYFNQSVERHRNNKVSVINCAIGECNCNVDISVGGALSTISKDVVGKFNSMEWSKGYHNGIFQSVEQRKLDDIFVEQGVPRNFDVLSVDVEGYEWKALKGYNIKEWSPKIVIIELHDNNMNYEMEWGECNKLVRYFDQNGYRVVYKDFSNTVYVRKDICQQ